MQDRKSLLRFGYAPSIRFRFGKRVRAVRHLPPQIRVSSASDVRSGDPVSEALLHPSSNGCPGDRWFSSFSTLQAYFPLDLLKMRHDFRVWRQPPIKRLFPYARPATSAVCVLTRTISPS